MENLKSLNYDLPCCTVAVKEFIDLNGSMTLNLEHPDKVEFVNLE